MNTFRSISLLKTARKLSAMVAILLVAAAIAAGVSAEALKGACLALDHTERHVSDILRVDDQHNRCPVANAGRDLKIMIDQPILLDASASSDLDGQFLQFEWNAIHVPRGSRAKPEVANALRTQFVADLQGDYIFELKATDSMGGVSTDRVLFSTGNVSPIARAGTDLSGNVGELIVLDAARSFDMNFDQLNFRWKLVSQPVGSKVRLDGADKVQSSFTIDVPGDYWIELVANDGKTDGVADYVRISTENMIPVANVGRHRALAPYSTLLLDGSGSFDYDNEGLSYRWSLLHAPRGEAPVIDRSLQPDAQLVLGGEGLYLFQLVVSDGVLVSEPQTHLVEVVASRLTDIDINDYLQLTESGGGDDVDGDGVVDELDNCVLRANPAQRDTDGDGIGNFCDPDLNNDGIVNFLDVGLFSNVIFTGDEDADFDGIGGVNFIDYAFVVNAIFQPPGPPGTVVWVSLVDGDWDEPTNWSPQVVPTAGVVAIVDVAPAVTVTMLSEIVTVKKLVHNENMVMSNSSFEATQALELGGTIVATALTLNDTIVIPSMAGSGTMTLNAGIHTWSNNGIGVDLTLLNGANINQSNGMVIDGSITIDAPSSPTGLIFTNDQFISGSGAIIFDGVGNSVITEPRLFPLTGTTVTFSSPLQIRGGKGTIGQFGSSLVMNANVIADVAGESIQIVALQWNGVGLLEATNGGNLQLGGNFNNGGNTLLLNSVGGSINLLNGAAWRNSTVTGVSGTNVTVNAGITTFENITYTGDMNLVNASTPSVTSGLTFNGNLLISAPSSPTGLTFTNDQTLGGNATITIDGTGNTVISEPRLFPLTGTTLTVGPNVLINGGNGTIGQLGANLIMNGDLTANTAGLSLAIGGLTWNSTGTFASVNDGDIALFGNFDNGDNTLSLDTSDGTIQLLNAASLRNATITGTSGTDMTINSGTTTFDNVNLNYDLSLVNAATVNVENGLTLNGDAVINAPSSPTGFVFLNTQTFDGTATVTLDGVDNSVQSEPRLFPLTGTTLTIGPNITIDGGKGTVGQGSANLIFLGDVNANVNAEEIAIGGLTWSANGSMQAVNGGGLRFYGNYDNGGGALALDTAGGELTLTNGGALRNATLNGVAGTNMLVSAGTTTLDTMTMNLDMLYENAANSNVSGGLVVNGTMTIDAPTSPTGLVFTETQTLSGNASIVFDGVGNTVLSEPRMFPLSGTTLTIAPTVTMSGGKGSIGQASAGLVMNGTVSADISGETLAIVANTWSGTGTINASNGGAIELAGSLDNANQALSFDTSGGSMSLRNGAALRNANLMGASGTAFTMPAGSYIFEDLIVNADLVYNNAANATVTDGLTLNGTATINAPNSPTGFVFNNTQTLDGNAVIVFNGTGNTVISEPRMFPLSGTELTIASTVSISGDVGTVGQAGAITILSGSISADAGDLQVVRADLQSGGMLEAINGNNLALASSDSLSGGTIHIGDNSSFTSDADPMFGSALAINIDIGSLSTAGLFTTTTTNSNYAGNLTVSAVNGYSPNVGDSFVIFAHTNGFGAFDSVTSTGLGGGESFTESINASEVTVTVTN